MENESRIDQAARQWEAWEQRLEKLSPGHTGSRQHMAQKLAHLEMLRAKHLLTNDPFEKLALQAIKGQQRKLERALYPNLVARLLRRLLVESDIKRRAERYNQASVINQQSMNADLKKAGLEQYAKVAFRKMQTVAGDFSIPAALATGEKEKMDLLIHFKHQADGSFSYSGYQASLKSEQGKTHTVDLKDHPGMNVRQAYNLLQGRAVYLEGSGWQQLDFTDKDAIGNNKIRHIPDHNGFDTLKALAAMPLKLTEQERLELGAQLKQGEMVTAVYTQGKTQATVKLEAAPARAMIRIVNSDIVIEKGGVQPQKNKVMALHPQPKTQRRQKSVKI